MTLSPMLNVLVHRAMAAEKHMVADMAMPAKHGVVGNMTSRPT